MPDVTIPLNYLMCIAISALISIGFPVALFFILRKKIGLKVFPMVCGAAAFVILSLGLRQLLHTVVLRPDASGQVALEQYPFWYNMYRSFSAGIFEETARLLVFLLLGKKYAGRKTALSYGIGHGGIESIMLVGLSLVYTLVVCIMINSGAINLAESGMSELFASKAPMILLEGMERILALIIQISLSIVVWSSVQSKKDRWLFLAAIVYHAIIDFGAGLYITGVIKNHILFESIVFLEAFLVAVVAWKLYQKAGDRPTDLSA